MDAVFYQFFRNAVHNEFSFPVAIRDHGRISIYFSYLFFFTFDIEYDSVSVCAVYIFDDQVVLFGILWTDFLHDQPGDVAVFSLGMLHQLFRQVASVQILWGAQKRFSVVECTLIFFHTKLFACIQFRFYFMVPKVHIF